MRLPRFRLLPLTMLVMAALLLSKSLVLVGVVSPGSAPAASLLAAQASTPPKAAAPPPAAAPAPAAPAPAPAKPAEPVRLPPPPEPVSESERALLVDLRHRRSELESREATLLAREATLGAAERRLSTRVDELMALQGRLESLETARREHDEANWRGLVKLYETMRPRDAAVIFNDLDRPVLLGVLDRMKEARAAPVLAAMQPERARQATADLAAMRAQATAVPPGK